jgi:hypothetical protein
VKAPLLIQRLIDLDSAHKHQDDVHEALALDAAFFLPGSTQLRLMEHGRNNQVANYLDHAITRAPQELRSHVQRIYLHLQGKDSEAVYGALVDLFIVLKAGGRSLRERMLKLAKAHLEDHHHRFLHHHLETGITELQEIPACRTSLLSKGISGTSRLVIKGTSRFSAYQDPLQLARDHLEYGQIEQARQVLEKALLEQPSRPELQADLLDIYKRTHARDAFQTMHRRLQGLRHPQLQAWRELAVFFQQRG